MPSSNGSLVISIKPPYWRINPLLVNDSVNTFPREPTRATKGRLLLGSGSINTPKTIRDNRRRCFLWGPFQGCVTRIPREQLIVRSWESSVVKNWVEFWRWQSKASEDNGKEGISLWKEDFVCDLKWQWNCYKSVARIRLVKTENPSACVTVNCKLCRSAIALYCL
jgi:hypothetical protein